MAEWDFDTDYLEEPELSDDTISVSTEMLAQRDAIAALGETEVTVNFSARDYKFSGVSDPLGSGGGPLLGIGVRDMTFTGVSGTTFTEGFWSPGALSGPDFEGQPNSTFFLEAVTLGDTVLRLRTIADASNLSVGDCIAVTGYDLQGGGFPQNPFYSKFVRITDVDEVTGEITVDEEMPFTLSTNWPVWASYSGTVPLSVSHGGPACIMLMRDEWKGSVEYNNIDFTWDVAAGQAHAKKEYARFNNCTWATIYGVIPTQNKVWHWSGGGMPTADIEIDKMIDKIIIDNGASFPGRLNFQSPCNEFHLDDSSVAIIDGGARFNYYTNSTIGTINFGAHSYGRTEVYDIRDCVLTTQLIGGVRDKGVANAGVDVTYTLVDGVLTCPGNFNPNAWAIPGTQCFWYDHTTERHLGSFTVLDTYRTGGNEQSIVIDCQSFPPFDIAEGALGIHVHPCPSLTMVNVLNEDDDEWFVGHPPGDPMFSYSKSAVLTEDTVAGTFAGTVWGRLLAMNVNVITPVTGGSGEANWKFSAFDNYPAVNADFSEYIWTPEVDLRIAGVRQIRPASEGGTIGSAGTDADLTVPEGLWLTGSSQMGTSQDITGLSGLTMTIEWIVDQGFANVETARQSTRVNLRLR